MDQIQNNHSTNSNNSSNSSNSPTISTRQRALQYQLQQQRLHAQQQQQQLYNLLPPQISQGQVHNTSSSYSSQTVLPPITGSSGSYYGEDLNSPTHTTPPTSASATGILPAGWPSHHRTSNSRDEAHPSRQQQQYEQEQQYQQQQQQQRGQHLKLQRDQPQQFKREREETMAYNKEEKSSNGASGSSAPQQPTRGAEDAMPSTSDFVKKLYKMLEDPNFQSVVCWGPLGDCFVVKDMNEFTKSILPRMFKHSNFASFVRQLNKYDFHKVKNTDDNQFGEHSWTFRHPDFHADRRDALENIKRKVPAQRKPAAQNPVSSSGTLPAQQSNSSVPLSYGGQSLSSSNSHPYPLLGDGHHHRSESPSTSQSQLKSEIQRLKDEGDDLRGRIRNLERNYENVLVEMVGFQRGMAQQDGLMQSLIAYFLGSESGKLKASTGAGGSNPNAQSPSTSPSAQIYSSSPGAGPSGATSGSSSSSMKATAHQLLKQQIQAHLQNQQNPSVSQLLTARGQSSQAQAQSLQAQLRESQKRYAENADMSMAETQNQYAGSTAFSPDDSRSNPAPGSYNFPQQGSNGEADQRTWANVEYGVGDSSQSSQQPRHLQGQQQQRAPQSNLQGQSQLPSASSQQKPSRTDALNQIRDLHRERMNQGGWANAPQLGALDRIASSGNGVDPLARGRGGFGEERGKHRDRENARQQQEFLDYHEREKGLVGGSNRRGGDSSSVGPEDVEDDIDGSGLERSRRRSDSPFMRSSGELVDRGEDERDVSPEEYVMPSPVTVHQNHPLRSSGMLQKERENVQQQQQQSQQQSPPSLDSWNKMMSAPFSLGTVPGFNGTSSLNREATEADLAREGLQVYTVGHLLPRNAYSEDAQGNWSFDTTGLTMGGMLGGLGIGGVEEGSEVTFTNAENNSEETVRPSSLPGSMAAGSSSSSAQGSSTDGATASESQKLRVRRSTFVPGWAVPPRVLLVDDDAVSRKLSSKFLKVFGCTIDVAVDGIGAVNKMNLEKYDLVLMDIVMPKLDGVSATNLIRKFDKGTPIISMTSNSKPNEIMTYYSSGMNDILPKPFTKKGLLDMLEKHLMHLKVIQQMSKIPRSVGVPPLSDPNFEQALTASANNLFMQQQGGSSSNVLTPSFSPQPPTNNSPEGALSAPSPFNFQFFGDGSDDDAQINPLAGMGLSDEQYSMILQNIVNGDGFMGMMESMGGNPGSALSGDMMSSSSSGMREKRALDDPEDERDGKRSRFEVIE